MSAFSVLMDVCVRLICALTNTVKDTLVETVFQLPGVGSNQWGKSASVSD